MGFLWNFWKIFYKIIMIIRRLYKIKNVCVKHRKMVQLKQHECLDYVCVNS